jgi:hypothetical protein
MLFHIKTLRGTLRAFLIDSIKLRLLMYGMVRFALKRKISIKTAERQNLIHAFKQKSRKTVKKIRFASRSTKTVSRGKR